jgi:curved DNA-binding protein CbpA
MLEPDYYAILGVHHTTSEADIGAAYLAQALRFHPDKLPPMATTEERAAAVTRTQDINKAREVLMDPVKRAAYDATRQPPELPDVTMAEAWKIWWHNHH